MDIRKRSVSVFVLVVMVFALAAFPISAGATHSWGGYHWARTSNPFTLKLGDNVSGAWDAMLVTASSDWTQSNVMNTTIVPGGTRPKNCRATVGRVEVCNASYGNTGWLGVAQISITGGTHITQGTVKNNDYYFGNSTYQYNNAAEMQHVICQEIGHTFGLDHQSTDGSSQNTCMDYYHNTSASDTTSTHPNQHDYDELAIIYQHLDSSTTIGSTPASAAQGDFSEPGSWGELVSTSASGGESTYVRDLGHGNFVVTFVIWANE
jgi:hypothetical protein